jgi:carbamoyl-phosphate synthase small subunit
MKKATLLLQDGSLFSGKSLGHIGETVGEVCFNTGMTGYQEILTDPSYCKQVVAMTSPHVGNYGINANDFESKKIQAAGFVIKEGTDIPSNWQSKESLDSYLKREEIVGIQNIDTRALTRHIRDFGAMNGIISSIEKDVNILKRKLEIVPSMNGQDLVKEVTCNEPYTWANKSEGSFRVAAIDYGIKHNILRLLNERDCTINVFPADKSPEEIMGTDPDGIFLSNGPGDPSAVSYGIKTVKALLGKKPIFGICLGHQILALALGATTSKLKFGHRGINHPVKKIATGTVEITSQNHGFVVDFESLPENVAPTHVNLNDNTLAGISCDELSAFSVQYHPESSPGPHDSRYLFNHFIDLMKNAKEK